MTAVVLAINWDRLSVGVATALLGALVVVLVIHVADAPGGAAVAVAGATWPGRRASRSGCWW